MYSCQNHSTKEISEEKIADIKTEIKEAALKHLNAENAISALSYYTKDATVICNGTIYPSFESFSGDIKKFYGNLNKINLAAYDKIDINILTKDVALLTAKFRWSSTDKKAVTTDLQGVYSALYVFEDDRWKMDWRHESYIPMEK